MLIAVENLQVVAITETWAHDCSIADAELSFRGTYKVFRCDRTTRGGGVAFLIANHFPASLVFCDTVGGAQILAVDVSLSSMKIRFITVYTPSSHSLSELSCLVPALETLLETRNEIVLCGDFNLPDIDWDFLDNMDGELPPGVSGLFASFCLNFGLTQHIRHPTSTLNDHILDLVLTHGPIRISNVFIGPPFDTSDHNTVFFSIMLPFSSPRESTTYRNFHGADFAAIECKLLEAPWNLILGCNPDVSTMYTNFLTFVHSLVNKFVPLVRTKKPFTPSHPIGLRHLISLRKRVWRKRSLPGQMPLYRKLTAKFRSAVAKFGLRSEINLSNNPAKFYAYARRRTGLTTGLPGLMRDGSGGRYEGNQDIACAFSAFFLSNFDSKDSPTELDNHVFPISSSLRTKLNVPPIHHVHPSQGGSRLAIAEPNFEPHSIYVKLKALKNKTSLAPDDLPPILFKRCALGFADPLSIIFKQSWSSSSIPDVWRRAIVIPVHKKESRERLTNYRPISMTCICCKVMESLVKDSLVSFLDGRDLLTDTQFGFRKSRSTVDQLIGVHNDWALSLNNGVPVDVIFVDFKSAFDRVNHKILLAKLAALGPGEAAVDWVRDFLLNRSFSVKVGTCLSDPLCFYSGVPQGSVIGPLLFLIFINDLTPALSDDVRTALFADDLKFYSEVTSTNSLQMACHRLSEWSRENKLPIALNKCSVLHLGNTNPHHIYRLCETYLQCSQTISDLGVITSNNLTFSAHCSTIVKKSSRVANLVLRSFSTPSSELYIKAFCSLVRPMLEYASVVWSPGLASDKQLLQRVQNCFLRRVARRCNIPDTSTCQPSLEYLESRRIKADLRYFNTLTNKDLFSRLFKCVKTSSRAGSITHPWAIAKTKRINDLFAWRVSRLIRN